MEDWLGLWHAARTISSDKVNTHARSATGLRPYTGSGMSGYLLCCEAKQGSKHMHICSQAQASPQSQPWTADMAEKGAHLAVRGMARLHLLRPPSVVHSPIIAH